MKVRYVGPHTEGVDIDSHGLVAVTGVIEVDDELGASLLQAPDNWQLVKDGKADKAAKDGE